MIELAKEQLAAIAGVSLAVARFGVELVLGTPARRPKDGREETSDHRDSDAR